jgi:cold shock CspA family protein
LDNKVIQNGNAHIPGISMSVELEGRDLSVRRRDGYVGHLTGGRGRIFLHDIERSKVVFHVAYFKKDWITVHEPQLRTGRSNEWYWRGIEVRCSQLTGEWHTEYPYSTVYVAEVHPPGFLKVWRVALVSQNQAFYLITEVAYCDGRNGSPPVVLNTVGERALREALRSRNRQLPGYRFVWAGEVYGLYRNLEGTRPEQGRVIWWSKALGLGALQTWYGEVRAHWSQLVGIGGLAALVPGQLVEFAGIREPVATKDRPSKYKWDAFGIRPLP